MWVVIGLAGVTCGGKTTLASSLVEKLKHDDVQGLSKRLVKVIAGDNYFFPKEHPGHVKIDGIGRNWELNSSIDVDRIYRDMQAVTEGTHGGHPSDSLDLIAASDISILIVDGHTILNAPAISAMCSLKYFFTLPKDECLHRRKARKYLNPEREGYFERAVWPSHIRHRQELVGVEGDGEVVLIDGTMDPDVILGSVVKDLNRLTDVLMA